MLGLESFAWEQLGVAAGAVLICITMLWAGRDILLALVKGLTHRHSKGKTIDATADRRSSRPDTWMQMTAAQIKTEAERVNDSQDERIRRLEERIGNEVMAAIAELRADIKSLRDRSEDKNSQQDALIGVLATNLATLQGMTDAKR